MRACDVLSEQVFCGRCGEPFILRAMHERILKIVEEKKLTEHQEAFVLCPKCRKEVSVQRLVGNQLMRVFGVQCVTKRRSEKLEPVKVDSLTGATVYKSQCFICNTGCDATVYVKDGRVIKVEGDASSPVTKGIMCSKGLNSRNMIYHPERILYPLKRVGERGKGKWQRISWDEALDTVVAKFKEIEEKYGHHAILLAQGTSRGWWPFFGRFANAVQLQQIGPGWSVCFMPRYEAGVLTVGGPAMECPDYQNTQCMLIWGANPPATWPVKALHMMDARARGAKMIVVDPVFSESASKADIWLQVRPGTDAALALGMLNVIISEELYDREFVQKWCVGFEELKKRTQEFSLKKVEEITWVPRERVIQAARMFATTKPACITQVVANEENADTISTCRAVTMLAVITGNIDVPGGNIFPMSKGTYSMFGSPEFNLVNNLADEAHEKRLGSKEYPLLAGKASLLETPSGNLSIPSAHPPTAFQAILTGKPYRVRALYCHGSNMLVAYANSKVVKEALMSLDFFAIADLFMTPTVELADIVLPAATWMERDHVHDNIQVSPNVVHLQQKTVEVGECWTDFKILNELAHRMGYGDLMFDSDEECCDFILEPLGIRFREFKKLGMIKFPYTYRKYEEHGFNTPSRKVELYSQRLKDLGYDPLPRYREPTESPYSKPELAKEYPLIITTGGRVPVFRHAELRNMPWLREIVPELEISINPKTAEKLGIKNGDRVIVESPRGSIEAKAYLTEGTDPRVVQVPSHWPGKNNVNIILHNEDCAPMIGGTQLRGQLCRVRRAD